MAEPVKPRLLSSPSNQKGERADRQTDTACCPVEKYKTHFRYGVLRVVGEGRGHIHPTHPHTDGRLHISSERLRPWGRERCRESTIGVTEVEEGNHLFVLKPN